MKCFECNSSCITVYLVARDQWVIAPENNDKIIAVRKDCTACDWHSYPTQIPITRQTLLDIN
jgi:hypothetical protein